MSKYYYTTSTESPPVYHTNQKCSEGEKIEEKNRVNTDIKPTDRRPCEVC